MVLTPNRYDVLRRAIERLSALQDLTDDLIEVALLQEEINFLRDTLDSLKGETDD